MQLDVRSDAIEFGGFVLTKIVTSLLVVVALAITYVAGLTRSHWMVFFAVVAAVVALTFVFAHAQDPIDKPRDD